MPGTKKRKIVKRSGKPMEIDPGVHKYNQRKKLERLKARKSNVSNQSQ